MTKYKTETQMEKKFIDFLVSQGYPKEVIECEQSISSQTAKIHGRLDVAIIIGDKIIQAFELKKDAKTKNITRTLQQVGVCDEMMDSVKLSTEIHIVTYDDGKWWIFSKQEQSWLNASILSFERVAREFYIKAYKQVKHEVTPIEKPNIKWVRITCWSIAIIALLYLIAYIALYAVKSCGKSVWDLPLSLDMISMFAIIGICLLLPTLLPFIKSIKFSAIELQLYANNYFRIKRGDD
jgi:hypothetical protein